MLDWFRGRGNAETGPRDGEAPVLEQMALGEPAGEPFEAAPGSASLQQSPRDRQRDILFGKLSEKVLNVHLANRFQTSYPLVLDFRSLAPSDARLLVEVAACALQADPRMASDAEPARAALADAHADGPMLALFDEALSHPLAASLILAETARRGLSSHAYAVSLLALGRPSAIGRHYLAYLAARLGLGEEITASLRRRYQR